MVFVKMIPKGSKAHKKMIENMHVECEHKPHLCKYPSITDASSKLYGKAYVNKKLNADQTLKFKKSQLVMKFFHVPDYVECGFNRYLELDTPRIDCRKHALSIWLVFLF